MHVATRALMVLLIMVLQGSLAPVRADPVPTSTYDVEIPRYLKAMQRALAKKGYDPGPADGVIGDKTKRAIDKYAADHGISDAEVTTHLGVDWAACFWLDQQLKCPQGCEASILGTRDRVVGYVVSCPGFDPTTMSLP